MDPDKVRQTVKDRLEALEIPYKTASEMLGKNHAYVQQYLERGIPVELPEKTRKKFAEILNIEETEIGGPESSLQAISKDLVMIPEYEISPNDGLFKNPKSKWQLSRLYLEQLNTKEKDTFIMEVADEAMAPTFSLGEKVMINQEDRDTKKRGIFLILDDDTVLIRRIEHIPANKREINIICDNDKYQNHRVPLESLEILGRVVWAARPIN